MKDTVNNITQVNRLLFNVSCSGPQTAEDIFTYLLTDSFNRFSTFLAILNIIAILPTIILNGIIVIGFIQQKKIRTRSNRLLFSICIADFLVGLIVEPIMSAHIIKVTKRNHDCGLSNSLVYLIPVLLIITMITHTLIAIERLCSIRQPNTYQKIFTKRNITWSMAFIWLIGFLGFVVPLLSGNAIIGIKILFGLIFFSLAICSYCYITLYQEHTWRNGRPVTKIQGAYVVRTMKTKDRSLEEDNMLTINLEDAGFFSKLYICMLVFYVIYLITKILKAYNVFKGNDHFSVQYVFDTLLNLHSLGNPCLILFLNDTIRRASFDVFWI
ncbi:uncharacterized protein LOC105843494 [Hydra vulgaris]|uniref:uncharacterized protein LOC105843494 n=1 Tax=Hydra vulgaris TaxID=6087 RepID=UPI000640C0E9|nr:uncharacterized protein LOC105843494 [Hydra vulgaris]